MTQYENQSPRDAESRDDASLDRLESDIAVTRERMRDDLGQLGERLSPQHLKAEAKAKVRDAAYGAADTMRENTREAGSRISFAVRDNPIPAAMVGVGLSWLAMKAFRGERRSEYYEGGYGGRYDYGRTYSYGRDYPYGPYTAVGTEGESRHEESHGGIGARVGEAREKISEAASSAVDTVREKAHGLASSTRERADTLSHRASGLRSRASGLPQRARGGFDRGLYTNPLAMALGALAAGLTAGLLIPETERENEMFGPTRDRLMERGRDVAERVTEAVSETAREQASTLADTAKSAAQEVASGAKEAATRVAQEAKSTAKSESASSASNASSTRSTQQRGGGGTGGGSPRT